MISVFGEELAQKRKQPVTRWRTWMWFVKLIYQPCYVVVFIKDNMIILRQKSQRNEIFTSQAFACFTGITTQNVWEKGDKRSPTIIRPRKKRSFMPRQHKHSDDCYFYARLSRIYALISYAREGLLIVYVLKFSLNLIPAVSIEWLLFIHSQGSRFWCT